MFLFLAEICNFSGILDIKSVLMFGFYDSQPTVVNSIDRISSSLLKGLELTSHIKKVIADCDNRYGFFQFLGKDMIPQM